ncbi:MAG: cyclodeaminase/cyclohydrolase family protein, partial [Nocardioidaceae bacterium]|nr:cyclodeaminase/cyclohydrolase family protein [Nocardioidaceae bacterium]
MSADGDGQPMLDQRVGALAEAVAARTPAPGAGAVTGLAAVLAAALAAMVARFSADDAAAAECDRLRRRLEPLGDEDAAAYEAYLAAIRLPRDDVHRSTRVVDTLSAATDVPMHLVELAAEVAAHAARLARDGNPRLRGDA